MAPTTFLLAMWFEVKGSGLANRRDDLDDEMTPCHILLSPTRVRGKFTGPEFPYFIL